ncbi:MAG: FAD-dependent oxidoreductase, partial [Eubacterium sp.]|nr:FAD-dependent oxidoreductase [Eubacterium sp.]
FREHADKLGCEFKTASVLGIKKKQEAEAELRAASDAVEEESGFLVETDEGVLHTKTVIAAMGAGHAKLNIPGEEEFAGAGVSYCATCDGAFFRNKVTAVIGGGDVAAEDAIFLARACEKVYLIHRRDELRAAKILQEEVMSLPNVEILWDATAEEIKGKEQVETVVLKNVKSGEIRNLDVDGVFIAVGIIPDSEILKGIVSCDEKGYVIAGEDCASDMPGIFAAGDIRGKKLRQIITAAADGANAVTAVQEYLLRSKITK